MAEFSPTLRRYLVAVSAAGLATLALLVGHSPAALVDTPTPALALLAVLVVLGEVFPIKLPGDDGEFTTSTTFAFALVITGGPEKAVVALAVGSIITDLLHGRSVWHGAFNVAQYTLALAAAGLIVHLLTALPNASGGFAPRDLPAILLGASAFFLVNNSLAGTASALAADRPIVRTLVDDTGEQAWTAAMLLGLAPVVALTADFSVLLLPWLLLPIIAVYRGGQAALFQHQANHDALTGLPARRSFLESAADAVRTAKRTGAPATLMVLDLDAFKQINDTLGHHRGDHLLRLVAPRLRDAVGDAGTVGRLGGDEFGVVLPGADADEAVKIAAAIETAFAEPCDIEGLELRVRGSIGYACHPGHGDDVDLLLRRADAALYAAKRNRSGVEPWAPGYEVTNPDTLGIAVELSRALDQQQIVVYYQPKVGLADGRITGVEALVRWIHPEKGLIPPDEFIPYAERTGLMRRLTSYVLEAALRHRSGWASLGIDLQVAINVSVSLLDRELPAEVERLLDLWSTDGGHITLEITESTVMADPVLAARVLGELERLGVRLSIDDFGTGYSSLAYLKNLPVNEIKIDRAFVDTMVSEPSDAMIVRSTIDLGHNLGLAVVAEGIENEETWSALRDLGCDYAQGYFMSKPVPPEDVYFFERERWPRAYADIATGTGTVRDAGAAKVAAPLSS
jgi:diguanylate cyclase (GGDEF)-like protein